LAVGLLAGLAVGGAAFGAEPLGAEFQVNTYTTGYQLGPSVAADADGNFVVVWTSGDSYVSGPDGSGRSIQGQRFDASGNAIGAEFQVNTYTTDDQWHPSVAADADGNFVVVWQSEGSAGTDTSGYSVQGQRYDAGGNTIGTEFQVNTYTTGSQRRPSVAADADGDFFVVWEGNGIQGQRYDASGNPLCSQFQVNIYTTSNQGSPWVAMNADGDSVVVWRLGDWGATTTIYEQRFDASGNAAGFPSEVSSYTFGLQYSPSVAMEADGDFVVAWGHIANYDASYALARRYNASGIAKGPRFQVAAYTLFGYYVGDPAVAADDDGEFIVAWRGWGRSYPNRGWSAARHYDANGDLVGSAFSLPYSGGGSGLAVTADEQFVGVGAGYVAGTDDTAVVGQRFAFHLPPVPSLTASGVVGLALLLFGIAAVGLRGRLH